ncbi:hypothetical protein SAMN05660733_00992 [Lentzea albidocapillata]|uniref:Uncharacterized protein n=1 Tax=Lentzea albidocapillata TaxID=40571 RepID=A0A1W2B2X8_9PSEU|nr:hypothetical protein SAMN05660733_00992 [Lentzea albidocapillata]
MSIEDHRRRLNGSAESTGQLSVAELIARREAETVEIPVITADITPEAFEPTIKFKAVKAPGGKKKQPMKELHITELLRREGRADDTQRGGFTVGKLAAAASGGVIICGSVAFAASSWLSSPDERPLAEVRFDERAQARGASAGTEGVVKLPSNKTQQSDATETQQADPTSADPTTRVAPYVQTQQQRPTQQTPTQQPTQQPTTETSTTPSTSTETSTPSTPPSSETPPPPSSSAATPPTNSTPPPSSENPLPRPSNPVDVSVDLGILDPVLNTVGDTLGGFDFFAPVN